MYPYGVCTGSVSSRAIGTKQASGVSECMRFDKASVLRIVHGVNPAEYGVPARKMSTLCGLPVAALVCSLVCSYPRVLRGADLMRPFSLSSGAIVH
jgi:hypothetical protein